MNGNLYVSVPKSSDTEDILVRCVRAFRNDLVFAGETGPVHDLSVNSDLGA